MLHSFLIVENTAETKFVKRKKKKRKNTQCFVLLSMFQQ